MPYSFLISRDFREYLFSKGVPTCQEKQLQQVITSWEIMTGE